MTTRLHAYKKLAKLALDPNGHLRRLATLAWAYCYGVARGGHHSYCDYNSGGQDLNELANISEAINGLGEMTSLLRDAIDVRDGDVNDKTDPWAKLDERCHAGYEQWLHAIDEYIVEMWESDR